MQVVPEPSDVIFEKLTKIRCCTGCLNNVNYLVFRHGLYCSSCLATIPEITNDHFINLQALSKIMADFTIQYGQRSRGQMSQLNLIKSEMEIMRKDVKKSKDSLSYDMKTVKQKSIASLDELYTECLKENQNEALQAFYQPDITASLILNQSQLLLQNVNNLRISEGEGDKISYTLQEGNKNPERINKKVKKQYCELNKIIGQAESQCQAVITNFMKSIQQEAKQDP